MKKIYFLGMCLFAMMSIHAQQITGVQVKEVLASDDFEDDIVWTNFDVTDAGLDLNLNNALGGTQTYNWSSAWGGAAIHPGKSAISGEKCLQLHWGGTLVLQGFEIDPEKIYQLEVMVHPIGGISGEWNNWGAIHLFIFDNYNIWQTQGMRVRVSNNSSAGQTPALLAYDIWQGEDGIEAAHDWLAFSDKWNEYTIDDAYDAAATNFWIPVKLIFRGEGTVDNPFIIDTYLNDKYAGSASITDMYWKGDSMIGLQNGASDDDVCRYDNIKLSVMENITGVSTLEKNKVVVLHPQKGILNVESDIYGKDIQYQLYSITGNVVAQGLLIERNTTISTEVFTPGVYIMNVFDSKSRINYSVKTLIK